MIKIGTKVLTPHGTGLVVSEEVFRTCERWGVKLDKNPFTFPVAFYFKEEVKKQKEIQCTIAVNTLS